MSAFNSLQTILVAAKKNGQSLKDVANDLGEKYTDLVQLVKRAREAGVELPEFKRGRKQGYRKPFTISKRMQDALANRLLAMGDDPLEADDQEDIEDIENELQEIEAEE